MSDRDGLPTCSTGRIRFVFALGMHRSGTSCLAGSLERCELFLGAVSRRAQRNPAGFLYEHREVVRLHHQMLAANEGSWRRPPPSVVATDKQRDAMTEIVNRLALHEPCGLKDPRLLLLLETWLEVVDSCALVGSFRHPAAVARSPIARAPSMSDEAAFDLWARYNAELVRWHRSYQFPIIEFDLGDVEGYCRTAAAMAATLGLYPDAAGLREFVTKYLEC